LDVSADHESDGAADLVSPLAVVLGDRISGIVDNVDVVTGAAGHHVGALASVDAIVIAITAELLVGNAGTNERLDIRNRLEAERSKPRADFVRSFVGGLRDDISE